MTSEKIRQKVQEQGAKVRRAALRGIIVPALVIGIAVAANRWDHSAIARSLFGIAIVWSLIGQFVANRGKWSSLVRQDVGEGTGLESYRREIERRQYLSSRFLAWTFGPVVLALAAFIVPLASMGLRHGMLLNMLPFLTLMVVWVIGVFVVRMRERQELQRDIDELTEIESANTGLK